MSGHLKAPQPNPPNKPLPNAWEKQAAQDLRRKHLTIDQKPLRKYKMPPEGSSLVPSEAKAMTLV